MSRLHTGAVLLAALALVPLAMAQTAPTSKEAPAPPPVRAEPAAKETAGGDPRVCLEFATNLQVMTCAEKYRPRRSAR